MIFNHLNERLNFEETFKFSPDFICIASHDGYFKKVNPMLAQTLGYSAGEILAMPIDSFIHLDDQPADMANSKQALSLLNAESRYITKNGEVVWVNWTSTSLANEEFIFAIGKNTTSKNQTRLPIKPLNSAADRMWINKFEASVRKHHGRIEVNLAVICDDLAIGERQLFRRTKTILGVTPNQHLQKIRLQIAMEAIQTGKYRTIAEIANVAGFKAPSYFKKLFENSYHMDLNSLL